MKLDIFTSTVSDGSMKSKDGDQSVAQTNRTNFLQKNGLSPENTTLHTLSYGGDDYCRYLELTDELKGDGILRDSTVDADAVVVTKPEHAVLLPLGDCVGAVIHDTYQNIVMVSHLGRQNLEQHGGTKCVKHLVDKYGVNPNNLTAWLSPAAGKDNYPMEAFDGRGLQDVAMEQLLNAGIPPTSISITKDDTTTDVNYFSHSEFLKGHRPEDGRFCIVAIMHED